MYLFNFMPKPMLLDKVADEAAAGGGDAPEVEAPDIEGMIDKAVSSMFEKFAEKISAKLDKTIVTPSQKDVDLVGKGGFKDIGAFAAVVEKFSARRELDAQEKAALMETRVGPDGGILVPPEFSNKLFTLAKEKSQIWSRATMLPVNGNSVSLPSITNYTHADDTYYGGVYNTWLQEGATGTAVQPRFDMLQFRLHDNMTLVPITNDLLHDSPVTIAPLIETMVSNAIGLTMDNVILNGDGNGKPLGMFNSNCKIEISAEDDQTAATVVAQNIIKMFTRFNMSYIRSAIWMLNQTVMAQLMQLNIASGTAGSLIYMPPGGLSASPYGNIFGIPIVYTEFCKALGTVGDISLADPSQYLAIDKAEEAAWSKEIYFLYNKSVLRVMYRADGQMWQNTAFTPANGDTLSPVITLATRA